MKMPTMVVMTRLRKVMMTLATAMGMGLAAVAASAQTSPPPLQSIPSLDVPRYMGRWWEIAKFPNWFQRKCAADTSATYSLRPDGTVRVLNQCALAEGGMLQAEGSARQVGGPMSARLQVRFAPAWLSVLPFVWGDYWVIDLDERYELVAISEPKRDYLWILSRSPQVDPARYQALLARLAAMGLEVGRLEKTPQRGS